MSDLQKYSEKTKNFSVYVICGIMLAVMGFLAVQSLLFTTYVDSEYPVIKEKVFYGSDNFLINIFLLLIGCALMYLLSEAAKRISFKHIQIFMFVWFLILGFLWIFSVFAPTFADSSIVRSIAESFAEGNYALDSNRSAYLNRFPFQLGYIAYSQAIISLLHLNGDYNTLVFQIINVVLTACTMLTIVKIVNITADEKTAKKTAVLCMAAIQPVIFCTFVYGNIPALAFACAAVYFMILFMRGYKWYFGLVSALCIGISVCLKKNSYIILAAMVIIICFDFFKNRTELIKKAAYVAVCVLLSVGILKGVIAFYDTKTDIDLDSGIPITSWLAMGLGESTLENGWYNSDYSVLLYMLNDHDSAKTSEAALEIVKEEIEGFKNDLPYAASFFYRKVISQWNEPTYQSVWMSKVSAVSTNRWGPGAYATGSGEDVFNSYMNFYQQLIYVFAFVGIFFCLKNKKQKFSIFALIILGGFIYHLFFEAKAQYSLIYFVLMLPLAAYGFENIFNIAENKLSLKHGNLKFSRKKQNDVNTSEAPDNTNG